MAIAKRQTTDLSRETFDYAPAPESIDHIKIEPRYGLFIGGKMVTPHSKKRFPTINPATEQKLAELVEADEVDVDHAVKAADKAFDSWSRMAPSRRARYIFRISRILQERARELAVVETMDGGKPIKESRDVDIPLAAAHFFYYGGWADKLEWAFPNRKPRPLGVAGQVIPWNFPLLMLAWKIAPALAAGNTVVLKPASTTPLSALLFADVCRQADLPPGVVNIVPGPGEVGMALISHPGVDKVAFTGSTDVGAINSRAQLEKIAERVAAGRAEGAEMYQPACDLPDRGYFFRPTLFTNVAQSHRIAREEIFGPVLSVLTFRTPEEAVEKANNTPYGLSAGVWTEKGSRILWMAQQLRAGVVWANTFNRFDPTSPFGGYKESGFGRQGGLHGLAPYLEFDE